MDRRRRIISLAGSPSTPADALVADTFNLDSENDSDSYVCAPDGFSMGEDFEDYFGTPQGQPGGISSSIYTPGCLVSTEDPKIMHSDQYLLPSGNSEEHPIQLDPSSYPVSYPAPFPWDQGSLRSDPQWAADYSGLEYMEQNQLMSYSLANNDTGALEGNSKSQTTLIMEDVQLDMLSNVLGILLKSGTKFDMKIRGAHEQL